MTNHVLCKPKKALLLCKSDDRLETSAYICKYICLNIHLFSKWPNSTNDQLLDVRSPECSWCVSCDSTVKTGVWNLQSHYSFNTQTKVEHNRWPQKTSHRDQFSHYHLEIEGVKWQMFESALVCPHKSPLTTPNQLKTWHTCWKPSLKWLWSSGWQNSKTSFPSRS